MNRHDLVGASGGERLPERMARARVLLDARGQTKHADQNRLVLEQLDTRIAQIKQAIATGGAHRDAS